jgi:hypothetical protein
MMIPSGNAIQVRNGPLCCAEVVGSGSRFLAASVLVIESDWMRLV